MGEKLEPGAEFLNRLQALPDDPSLPDLSLDLDDDRVMGAIREAAKDLAFGETPSLLPDGANLDEPPSAGSG